MTVQVKDILHVSRQPAAFNLQHECLRHNLPGLSFLTPANILIRNYRMKKTSDRYLSDYIDHD
jgi:hypothetical protein